MGGSIGFMQGRLSPLVDGKIQAFPWSAWRGEFPMAQSLGLSLMEWTLDADKLAANPLMTDSGRREIEALKTEHRISIDSLTGDFFMQAPFHRVAGAERDERIAQLLSVCRACARVGVRIVVIPLVDQGRIASPEDETQVLEVFRELAPQIACLGISIAFESDFAPEKLADFIDRLPAEVFGVNYDIGNSASLGFDPQAEIGAYGHRILNVHVKDRRLGGTTVPLGTGSANFREVFAALARARYPGNFILQTARAADGDHARVLARYYEMTERWLAKAAHAA